MCKIGMSRPPIDRQQPPNSKRPRSGPLPDFSQLSLQQNPQREAEREVFIEHCAETLQGAAERGEGDTEGNTIVVYNVTVDDYQLIRDILQAAFTDTTTQEVGHVVCINDQISFGTLDDQLLIQMQTSLNPLSRFLSASQVRLHCFAGADAPSRAKAEMITKSYVPLVFARFKLHATPMLLTDGMYNLMDYFVTDGARRKSPPWHIHLTLGHDEFTDFQQLDEFLIQYEEWAF